MTTAVRVTAPSRLHFGMLSFGDRSSRQFGGVGVMLQRPGLEVVASAAPEWRTAGPLRERAFEFAERWAASSAQPPRTAYQIQVCAAPPDHVGLGTGTQLALAVAAGLSALEDCAPGRSEITADGRMKPLDVAALARRVGRGRRSAIGLHGFAHGGLLVEAGKIAPEDVSPLVARVELPAAWRFVLIRPTLRQGLSGESERRAFEQLPAVSAELSGQLCRQVLLHLLPAGQSGEFDEFSESLYEFGRLAGECFKSAQHGTYAHPLLADLVRFLRERGIRGVGQSSWGPTLFALLASELAATEFIAALRRDWTACELDLLVAEVNYHGAAIQIE